MLRRKGGEPVDSALIVTHSEKGLEIITEIIKAAPIGDIAVLKSCVMRAIPFVPIISMYELWVCMIKLLCVIYKLYRTCPKC